MGITNSNKEIDLTNIKCGESFKIRLSLTAEPDIVSNPVDIVLVLDRSGSMAGSPLVSLKNGANTFIDIIDEATDSSQDGQIGGGSKIGIVSFSTTASQDTQLITSVADLKSAVDNLTSAGNTNHADAFTKAIDLFDPASTNEKVIVMFTDGKTTEGIDPNTIATLAKAQGIIIYCIGLDGNGGIDIEALRNWASDPDSAYVAIAPTDEELEELFENLAKNIVNPGATNITIVDKLMPCFKITSLTSPSKGTASLIDSETVEWSIDELGVTQSEGAIFEFEVEHVGSCEGNITVNESITYTDDEGNIVTFPSPTINVECNETIYPEACPLPVDLTIDGCEDTIEFDAGELNLESLGRIVQLDVTLKNICPNKRVALAILLSEIDNEENEYKRGMKTMTIPAHTRDTCQDIIVKCIKFVLPEDLSVNNQPNTMCYQRKLRARFIAHYIDDHFDCCNID